ncbi:MAG TPA: universal stress protein [Ktedonobacteraceae bacterium]|nr:universal stress protein [Ktedonobacteraceae bacterium]
MNKRILLGIDAPISPATQHALRSMSEFVEQAAPLLKIILLHVIPIPYFSSPTLGMSPGHMQPAFFTPEQRYLAEEALQDASNELLKQGIHASQIETMIYTGVPADQITKAALELQVDFIVIGSRGSSSKQKIRRFFTGSTSRSILQLASCPVMIVNYPQTKRTGDLVTWYEKSIRQYLQEHTGDLTVFSPQEVAQMFVPPGKKVAGRKERAAAILALESLAHRGKLCRHDIKGEMKYVND